MDETKLYLGIAAIVVVAAAYRFAAARCRQFPRWRPWVIVASLAALWLVRLLIPWVDELSPSLRESPAGLFVVIPKLAAVSVLALGAIGAFLGAVFPTFPWRSDPAT